MLHCQSLEIVELWHQIRNLLTNDVLYFGSDAMRLLRTARLALMPS